MKSSFPNYKTMPINASTASYSEFDPYKLIVDASNQVANFQLYMAQKKSLEAQKKSLEAQERWTRPG